MTRTTVGATMRDVRVVDTVPPGLQIDLACTRNLLPAGVTVSYDPSTRQATFFAGDIPVTRNSTQWAFHINGGDGAPRLRLCTVVDQLAQPGDNFQNTARATAANSENQPVASATVQAVGSGQLGIAKSVDNPLVANGDNYTWSVEWGNTSTAIAFQVPT